MSLLDKKPQEEIKYLDKFMWINNAWWIRTTEPFSLMQGFRKVEDESIIPEEYYAYYESNSHN